MKTFVVRFIPGGQQEIEADGYVVIESRLEFRNIIAGICGTVSFETVNTIPLSAVLTVYEKKI